MDRSNYVLEHRFGVAETLLETHVPQKPSCSAYRSEIDGVFVQPDLKELIFQVECGKHPFASHPIKASAYVFHLIKVGDSERVEPPDIRHHPRSLILLLEKDVACSPWRRSELDDSNP